jgi:imidazolonepropionase-like amidohydrolase
MPQAHWRHINRETMEPLSQLSIEEVEVMVNEAHRWGMDVAAHAYGVVALTML